MQLEVHSEVDPGQWDGVIRSLGGTIYHSSAYARYVQAAQPSARPQYLTMVGDGGEKLGAALGFRIASPHSLLAGLTRRFWTASVPLVSTQPPGALEEFLRRLERHARDSGCVEMTVGSTASPTGREELRELGFTPTERMEFELGLEKSQDDLWKQMEYKRRKNIRKAERCGVVVRDLSGESGIAELRRLQACSSGRIVARGGRNITHGGRSGPDPVQVLLDSRLGRIVGAGLGDQIVSAGMFTHFNGLVYHTLSGHSAEAFELQAPTLLLWETIIRYKREGAERFNFGGCKAQAANQGDPEHGIYVYKMGFGARCITCASGSKVLRGLTYAVTRLARKALGRKA